VSDRGLETLFKDSLGFGYASGWYPLEIRNFFIQVDAALTSSSEADLEPSALFVWKSCLSHLVKPLLLVPLGYHPRRGEGSYENQGAVLEHRPHPKLPPVMF
jgi:hypothetical protein